MKFVKITPDDAEKYASFRNENDTLKWFFSSKKYSPIEVRAWLTRPSFSNEINLFGWIDDVIIGAVSVYNITDADFKRAEIGRVMVGKEFRKKGFGVQLLDGAKDAASDNGIDELYAFIKKNNMASIKAFKTAGYNKSMDHGDIWEVSLAVPKNINSSNSQ